MSAERRQGPVLVAVLAILCLSAGLRLWGLSSPREYIFDEVYYAKDARAILDGRVGPTADLSWEPGDVVSWPHPESGKFAIAAGIALLGDRPLGWRLPATLAGTALLACVYPLARRLGLTPGWALVALALAAADTLGIAQSRIATLDVFVALWTAVAVLCALRYVQGGRRPVWLLLAGLAGGLAVATKWSGALALLAALLVAVLPSRTWRGPSVVRHETGAAGGEDAGGGRLPRVLLTAACLVAVPAALYVAAYGQYFSAGHSLADWRELQRQMWEFNLHLSASHSYASAAPTWILDYRPVWYSFEEKRGAYYGIVAMGNPLLWWAATVALVVAPVAALKRCTAGLLGPAIIVAALYFPWFAATRTSFLYYMTPVAPFLAILVAAALAAVAGAGPTGVGHSATDQEDDAGDARRAPWGGTAASRRRLPSTRRDQLAAGAAAAFAFVSAAILWRLAGRCLGLAFREVPGRAAPSLAVTAAVVATALAALLLGWALRRVGRRRLRLVLAFALFGAITGIAVAFLPIVVNVGIPSDRFYELMWFPSWI